MNINKRARMVHRLALLLGLAVASAGVALFAATPAQAAIGTQPGNVSLSPASGATSLTPTYQTTTPCPAPNNASGTLSVIGHDDVPIGFVATTNNSVLAPFGGSLQANMATIVAVFGLTPGDTYEFAMNCSDANFNPVYVQSTFVTFSADGTSWTSSATPPAGGVSTTTSLVAAPTTAAPGDSVSLTATVTAADTAGNDAVGSVEFFDGTTSLGTPVAVAGGTASMSVSTLTSGSHSITAKFTPTDPNAFSGSTSSAAPVTITGGGGGTTAGTETVNVNIPTPAEGVFTVTVSNTPVSLGTAADNGSGALQATGTLSPVTVNDGRNVSKPGWNVSGQVGDFTQGTNTIDGNSLGWTPVVTTQDPAGDVVAGAPITAGSNPGLKQGGTLAGAAVNKGLGQSVLGGALDLKVPTTTNPGAYSATLTITALDTAS
jgi:hypothetical protein